jgi:type II secretory pathway component PulL
MIDIDKIEAAAHETINDDIENFMLMLPDHMLEMVALIRKQREVMQQALEALNQHCRFSTRDEPDAMDNGIAAIKALEEALE